VLVVPVKARERAGRLFFWVGKILPEEIMSRQPLTY
jgi:hypothetical protein